MKPLGIAIAFCCILVTACGQPGGNQMTVKLSGPDGAKLKVTLESAGPGSTREVQLPCEPIIVSGSKLNLAVKKVAGPDEPFRVEVLVNGQSYGMATSKTLVTGLFESDGAVKKQASIQGQ